MPRATHRVLSRLPSFSYSTEHLDEDRLCNEHFREPLDQGLQAMFWHHGDKFVEHATLPEQGVSASRGRVGLEMSIEAERFPGCAEQGQQRNREGIDQPQAVTPVGGTDVHRAEAMPKRISLLSRNAHSIPHRLA